MRVARLPRRIPWAALLALPLLSAACAAIGDPVVPGQHTQACVNRVLGLDGDAAGGAPPPAYVQVPRQAVRAEHVAYYVDGRVALTLRHGGSTLAHESARRATDWSLGRQPTAAEFAAAERQCKGRG